MKFYVVITVCLSVFFIQIDSFPQSNTNSKKEDGSWKLLQEIIKNGSESDIQELITNAAKEDLVGDKGMTPLVLAAKNGREDIVRWLLQNGRNIDEENELGSTALIHMAFNGLKSMADFLIQNGANVNYSNKNSNTALMAAAFNGHKDVVHLLIQKGANINDRNKNGNTALMSAIVKGYEEISELLIQMGADVNEVNRWGNTAIIFAANNGQEKTVDLLIQKRADINIANSTRDTALIAAAKSGHEHIVELLLQNEVNVNDVDNKNNTALHTAAINGHEGVVRLLVQGGANFSIKNVNGKTPEDLASEKGLTSIVSLIQMVSVTQRACHVYSSVVSTRILNGSPTEVGEFPWMAALGYLNTGLKISFSCGGTLISDTFVLTAAHCVKDSRRPVVVRLGSIVLTDNDDTRAENHLIKEIIRHPNYSLTEKKNDIALIRLVDRVYLSNRIRPACLHTDLRDQQPSVKLTVTGWGIVSTEWRNRSNLLLKTDVQTMPLAQCNTILLDFNQNANEKAFRNGISKSQYCAYDPDRKNDSCDGDSGGPLQLIQSDSAPAHIMGIVSFGVSCGTALPSIYTRVAYYLDWILPYVWPNGEIQTPLINIAIETRLIITNSSKPNN